MTPNTASIHHQSKEDVTPKPNIKSKELMNAAVTNSDQIENTATSKQLLTSDTRKRLR
jgi:hypothetical protein